MANKKNEDKKENSEKVLRHVVDDSNIRSPEPRLILYGCPKDPEPKKPKFRFPWRKEPKE